MVDIFEYIITTATTFPYNVIIVGIIIGYIIYTFYSKRKKPEEGFLIEDFRESAYVSTEKLLNNFGIEINCYLIKGIEPLGNITKFYNYKGSIVYETPKALKDKRVEPEPGLLEIFYSNPQKNPLWRSHAQGLS